MSEAGHSKHGASSDVAASTYTYGHHDVVVSVHQQRTAEREAAFFLPHLRPGMTVLDAGCGPGSITLGLAHAVAPALVTGIDFEESVLVRARALATARGVQNVRFDRASIYELPFPEASFDAVFAHTVLEHVDDPVQALRELRRVLRPGGPLGVRDCDWASGIFAPRDALVTQGFALYARIWRHNRGHPNLGRGLRTLLKQAGLNRIETSASFRWDGSLASSRAFGELLAHRLRLPNFAEPAVAMGWCDRDTLAQISAACTAWSRRDDIFAAMIMCEAVGSAGS